MTPPREKQFRARRDLCAMLDGRESVTEIAGVRLCQECLEKVERIEADAKERRGVAA